MPSSPEELLRSIERTREELALTVDTIAGRLDPRAAAKRSVGKVRSSMTEMFDGARGRRSRQPDLGGAGFGAGVDESATGPGARDGYGGGPRRPSASSAMEAAAGTAREAVGSVGSAARQVPTPAIAAALAALLAFAAILAARNRSRRTTDTSRR